MNTHSFSRTSVFAGDHLAEAYILKYATGDSTLSPAQRTEIEGHLDSCKECRLLLSISKWSKRTQPRRRLAVRSTIPDNVIHAFGPNMYQLSRAMLRDESSAAVVAELERVYRHDWIDRGLPSEATLAERVKRGDEIFFAIDPASETPRIMGILCGRISQHARPSYRELQKERVVSEPRSLNLYTVVVPEDFRGRGIGRELLLFCGRIFQIYPGIKVQSLSPAVGFLRFLARKLGLQSLAANQDSIEPVAERSLEEILAKIAAERAVLETKLAQSLQTWLVTICQTPKTLLTTYFGADAETRGLMSKVLETIADEFANAWFLCRGRNVALGCNVAHFHRINGGAFGGTLAFSNCDDPDSLYMTITFEYVLERLDERVEEYVGALDAMRA